MANLSEIKKESNWGDAASTINSNFQNINVDLEKVKSSTTKFKGYFTTETALKQAYPSPKVGDTAFVGEPYPGTVYDVQSNGAWHNTTKAPDADSVDLNDYATKEDLKDVEDYAKKATAEYNVSVFHPTSGTSGSNRYDLAGAIAQVPAELRSSVNTVSFLNQAGKTEKWEFGGGSWVVGSFSQVGAEKLTELEEKIGEGNVGLKKTVDYLYKGSETQEDVSSSVQFTDGYFLQANESQSTTFGKVSTNSGTSVSEYIDITNVTKIAISVFKSNTTTDNGCVFYDENKKALKGYRFENQSEKGTYLLELNQIPSDYKYIRTSILTSDKGMFVCKLTKISGGEGLVADIENRLSAVESKIEAEEDGIKTNFTSGSGILVDSRYGELGSIKTNSTLSYSDYVDCSGYDSVELTMPVFPSESGFGLCFYDSDKAAIIGYNINKGDAYGVEQRTFEIPSNASSFRTSYYTDTESYQSFQGKLLKKDPIAETVNELYKKAESSEYTDVECSPIFTDGVYLSTSPSNIGDEVGPSNDTSVTDFIKIGSTISTIQISVVQTTSGSAAGLVFYDSSRNPIKGYSYQGSTKKTIQAELNDFPKNSYYVRTTVITSDKSQFSIKVKQDLSEGIVPDINKRVANLEDKILSSNSEINVVYYGAKDGEDITEVLEEILKSLSKQGGGNIYIPKGTYKFKRPVTWKSKVNLRGDGIGLTILKPTSDLSVFVGSDISDFTMKDFTIDGDEQQKNSTVAYAKGIFQTKLTNVTYRDLEIKNTSATGLGVDFFISGVIDNVRCDNCGRDGDLSAPSGAAGCSGIGIGVGGFSRGNETLTISNCHCNNCKQNGIFIEAQTGGDGQTVSGSVVIGCTAEGNRIGFGISGGDSTQFIGCVAYGNHHAGFAYDAGTMGGSSSGIRPKFIGCVAKSNGQNTPEDYPEYMGQENGFGWYILKDFGGVELIGCNSLKNKKSGIEIVNGISRLNIDGGEISENGEHGINLNGSISEFRIYPLSIRYNGGDGIRINASLSKGLIKGISITKNNNGINKTESGNVGDAIINENFVYGNTVTDNNSVDWLMDDRIN